jgi:hypothetical protein
MQFGSSEPLPEDEEELDDWFENRKEVTEFVMEGALKWTARKNLWDMTREEIFRDILIQGRCFMKVELVNGLVVLRRVDPRLMIFDTNATNDLLTDSTYFGEVRYMSLAEATQRYKLSKEEADEIYSSNKAAETTSFMSGKDLPNLPVNRDNSIAYYKMEAGELRVLVVEAYWQDTKGFNHKIATDKHGNEHIKNVGDSKDSDIQKRVKIWRKGTLIGGKILKEWGEMENQTRDIDSLSETYPPYIGLIPYYMNGVGVSLTHQMKGLQNLKNIVWYNIQLAMSRAGAKGFVYDLAQLPEGWTEETMIKWLKTVGIGFINSKVDGIPAQFNQFQTFDLSISNTVEQYLKILDYISTEMDNITGINEARQGVSQGASQGLGVTNSQLFQSNLSTAPLFRMFKAFASRGFSQAARLIKIAWVDKEKFAPIIGDVGVDFLKTDVDLDLDDYGVFVEEVPILLDDKNMFQQLVMAALQSQSIQFVDALKLLREDDVTVGIRKFERIMKKREEEAAAQEQAMMEAQAQAQAQQEQMALQAQAQMEQQKMQAQAGLEDIKGQNAIKQILTKGKIDLTGKKIDALVKK